MRPVLRVIDGGKMPSASDFVSSDPVERNMSFARQALRNSQQREPTTEEVRTYALDLAAIQFGSVYRGACGPQEGDAA